MIRNSFLAFLLIASAVTGAIGSPGSKQAPPRYALVIVNSRYTSLRPLKTPDSQIGAVAEALKSIGFLVTVQRDLNYAKFGSALDKFVSALQPDSVVFVYFSGYGFQDEDNRDWLLPTDFTPKDAINAGVRAFGPGYILGEIEKKNVGPRFLVLDASHDCPEFPVTAAGLATIEVTTPKTLIISAAGWGQTVPQTAGDGPDIFTTELAKAIQTPAGRAIEIFEDLQNAVDSGSGGKQTPRYTSLSLGDFTFVAPPPPAKEETPAGKAESNSKDNLVYVWIPPGKFRMGCAEADDECANDEKPRHLVTFKEGFWMTWSEVTVEAYTSFVENTGHKSPKKTKTTAGGMLTDRPITEVTWYDANDYCKRAGGRLPTEAEWEYAARGGHKDDQIYTWGNTFDPDKVNSFKASKRKGKSAELTPVRHYPANDFNLGDMAGNAREWTLDPYDPLAYSKSGPPSDSAKKGEADKVIRGGSWADSQKDVRTSARTHRKPSEEDNQTGFRCVVPRATLNQ